MSDLKIQYVSPDQLRPYAGNARSHSKKQIRQIADSIERFGFVNPILVSAEFEIIAGHGRWLKSSGWQRHSVRGFLAGTVRKKLKLPLVSEKIDGVRTYRIGSAKTSKAAKKSARRLA